jgi:hypothetical protein
MLSSSARMASAKASTVAAVRVVAVEDRVHEGAVDRPPLAGEELGQLLASLLERRRAGAGPDEGVQRQARDALGVALREQRRAQRARADAVG